MALSRRLKKLEGNYGPELCEERHCLRPTTFVEVIRYPDGTMSPVGDPPPPLCESCPYREGGGPIRHILVVRSY